MWGNFLSDQEETFFSRWGRNSVFPNSLIHKNPPNHRHQHPNHPICRRIKLRCWVLSHSGLGQRVGSLCFADCKITACVSRASLKLETTLEVKKNNFHGEKNSQRLWNKVDIHFFSYCCSGARIFKLI